MTYTLYSFGTALLPQAQGQYDIGTGEAMGALTPLAGGGAWDNFGTGRAPGKQVAVMHRALLNGTNVQDQLDTLKGYEGQYGTLIRSMDDASQQFVMARLVSVRGQVNPGDLNKLRVEMNFQSAADHWGATALSQAGNNFSSGTIVGINVTNAGNYPVKNSILYVCPSGGTLTQFTIDKSGETSLKWTGILLPSTYLVIDCGAFTVQNNGVDAFSGLSRQSGQALSEWIKLSPGVNSYQISKVGAGTATIAFFNFYAGWA